MKAIGVPQIAAMLTGSMSEGGGDRNRLRGHTPICQAADDMVSQSTGRQLDPAGLAAGSSGRNTDLHQSGSEHEVAGDQSYRVVEADAKVSNPIPIHIAIDEGIACLDINATHRSPR